VDHKQFTYLGEQDDLSFTANCRYAISFDPLGYRDNASAMVNMVRAGLFLFCLNRDEAPEALCQRAARWIAACERSDDKYLDLLALAQSQFRAMEAAIVASRLDAIFAFK
jgi:hypothetical protein